MSQFEEKSPGARGLRDHGRAGPGLPRGRRGPRPGALRGVLEPALLPGPPRLPWEATLRSFVFGNLVMRKSKRSLSAVSNDY